MLRTIDCIKQIACSLNLCFLFFCISILSALLYVNLALPEEKMVDGLPFRNLENEGFYVGKTPPVKLENLSRMENRIIAENNIHVCILSTSHFNYKLIIIIHPYFSYNCITSFWLIFLGKFHAQVSLMLKE